MCYPLELPNKEGFTILQHVAIDNYVEMATLLIDSGAKIDKKNRDGRTALMYAAKVRKKFQFTVVVYGFTPLRTL